MATTQELEQAFLNAHNAGDKAAAQVLADAVRQSRASGVPSEPEEQTFMGRAGRALKQGLATPIESAAGIALGAKSALGMKEAAGEQAAGIRKEAEAEAGKPAPISWEEIEKTYGKEGLAAALKKAPAYLTEQVLQSAPSMAIPLAAAQAGAMAGAPLGPVGAGIAGTAAGIGAYGLQQFGSMMRRQAEEGATGDTLSAAKAGIASAGTAPIGFFADKFTLGLGKVPSKVVGDQVLKELAKRAGNVAKGAGVGIIAEAPTEVLEQAAERWQAGLDLTSEDAKREYKEAFFGAAAVGGTLGGASRLRNAPEAKPAVPTTPTGSNLEQQAQAARERNAQIAAEQQSAERIRGARQGEQMLDKESAEQAKAEAAQRAERDKQATAEIQALRAKREVELKETFPADYRDVIQRTNAYAELSKELASLDGQKNTKELNQRRQALQQQLAKLSIEDQRVPAEMNRIRAENAKVVSQLPEELKAKYAAQAFTVPEPRQMEMRGVTVEQPAGIVQKDLLGNEVVPEAPVPKEPAQPVAQQRTELMEQYDTLAREMNRLRAQFQSTMDNTQRAEILKKGDTYQNSLKELRNKVKALDAQEGVTTTLDEGQLGLTFPKAKKNEVPIRTISETPKAEVAPVEQPAAEITQPVPEPKLVQKPVALTPETVPTRMSPDVLGALGIGPSATMRKPDHGIHQLDIAKPEEATQVKTMLDMYKQGKSEPIVKKIDAYLARPEFAGVNNAQVQPAKVVGANKGPAGPSVRIPNERQQVPAKLPSAPQAAPLGPIEQATGPTTGGKGKKLSPLKVGEKAPTTAVENKTVELKPVPIELNDKDRPVTTKRSEDFNHTGFYDVVRDGETIGKIYRDEESGSWYRENFSSEKGKHFTELWVGHNKVDAVRSLVRKYDAQKPKGDVKYRTTGGQKASATRAMVEDIVAQVSKVIGGKAKVNVLGSVTDFDPTQRPGSRSGVLSDGEIYVFLDGIESKLDAEKTIFHELFHKGLRNLMSEQAYTDLMLKLYNQSAEIRVLTDAWIETDKGADVIEGANKVTSDSAKHERLVRAEAVEEVLAEMAENTTINPSILRKISAWAASIAEKFGMKDLAQYIRGMGVSPLQQFVNSTIRAGVGDNVTSQTRFRSVFNKAKVESEFGDATVAAIEEIQSRHTPEMQAAVNSLVNNGLAGNTEARKKSAIAELFRQATVDKFATVESKVSQMFSKGVRDAFGNLNPMVLARQAVDYAKFTTDFFASGGIRISKDGIFETYKNDASMEKAMTQINALAKKEGVTYEKMKERLSTVLEGHRLFDLRENHNKLLENSAKQLEAQGKTKEAKAERENIITLHMTNAEIDTLEKAYNASAGLKEIHATLNSTRKSAIDFMVATGRITAEQGKYWKDNAAYVPFDRVFEDVEGPVRFARGNGLAVVRDIPGMKGSLGRPVGNVFDAYAKRLGWMVETSMSNYASVQVLDAMALTDFATKLKNKGMAKNQNLVVPRLFKDGKPAFYEVQNEYDMLAFQQSPEIMSGLVKALSAVSRVLRVSITALPPFAISQVVQDAQRAAILSGVKRPMVVAARTLYNFPIVFWGEVTGRKSASVRALEKFGTVGDFDGNIYQPASDIEKKIGATKRGTAGGIFHILEQFTKASDLAARAAVYEETMRDTNDEVLAQSRARELINFSRKGSSASMRTASRIIPFFNAYAQGMDLVYRAASGKESVTGLERSQARKLFYSRMAMMTAMGFAFALTKTGDSDDDKWYQETDESVRDNNWVLTKDFKIPLPKEFGFVFKAIPERIVSYMHRNGTDEEQSILSLLGGIVATAFSAYGSPTAIPSAIRPILENITNYSFFLQRELESTSQKKLEPGYRTASGTSEVAKMIGRLSAELPVPEEFGTSLQLSPIKIDNLLKGLLGTAAVDMLMFGDAVLNPNSPDRPIHKLPFASIFMYDPVGSDKKSEFYNLRERVGEAKSTLDSLKATDPQAAAVFMEKNANLLSVEPMVARTLKQLSELRRIRNLLENGTPEMLGISSKERAESIKEIKESENEVVSYIRTLEKEIR